MGAGFGQQASPVFTIILSFLNLSNTLLVQPISMIKAASACKLEGLHIDVYHMYTDHFLCQKQTLDYSHILYLGSLLLEWKCFCFYFIFIL